MQIRTWAECCSLEIDDQAWWAGVWTDLAIKSCDKPRNTFDTTWKGLLSGHCGNDSDSVWEMVMGESRWEAMHSRTSSNAVTLWPGPTSFNLPGIPFNLMDRERGPYNAWLWALWPSWWGGYESQVCSTFERWTTLAFLVLWISGQLIPVISTTTAISIISCLSTILAKTLLGKFPLDFLKRCLCVSYNTNYYVSTIVI